MNISLTPELEQLLQLKVQSGRYASVSDVIGEALRLMDERDRVEAVHRTEIRNQIADGVASLRAGHVAEGEAFFDALDAGLAALEEHKPA